MPNAIEQIYDQLMQVFGGTNPNQFFSLLMPATTLNQASYAFDTRRTKPQLVAQAESLLVDQMFDVAKVSGSSNGERLSLQYMQALSVLIPVFDPIMPQMKTILRDYINMPAPPDAKVAGQHFEGNLAEYYFALYESWLAIKSAWDTDVQDQKNALDAERFLEWFEGHADGRLAEINAAFGRLLAVFSPADMDAILGALQAGPGGQVEEALAVVQNIRLPSPSGGYHYPVDLTPNDWFLDLASDMDPVDLLKDPEFIAIKISARRTAVMASIAQVKSLLAQVPTQDELKAAADKLSADQAAYIAAQDDLINTYAANTVTAVEMYLDAETGGAAGEGGKADTDFKKQLTANVAAVSKSKQEDPPETTPKKRDGTTLSTEDLQKILDGQKKLVGAQSKLLTSSQAVADAGMNLAADQARVYGDLPVMLARLQSQLEELTNLQSQVAQSAAAAANRPAPKPLLTKAVKDAATELLTALKTEKSTATDDAVTAVTNLVQKSPQKADLAPVIAAAKAAAASTDATPSGVLDAAKASAAKLAGSPTSASSETSQRFMSLQFAFETSSMEADSSAISKSSQTSFSVDLFFGSASGQSSDSSAVNTKNAVDSDTCIEIGFKAAKVDIGRGWFNPGVFKLTEGMTRLSQQRISTGAVDLMDPKLTAEQLEAANAALLPCFPVAFVVAKDVTIRFKATASSLDAVHSVIDSRSAAGGGFLCFSASSSSASHSDTSKLSSKSEDTVITIHMPGPQILGWFLEYTPADQSDVMKVDKDPGAELSIIDFVEELKPDGKADTHVLTGKQLVPNRVGGHVTAELLGKARTNGCAPEAVNA